MNRTQKLWLIAAFVAFDIVIIAAVVVWLLRDPYRASQAQQAQVSEARQPAEGESDESLEAVPFDTADLMFTGSSALGEQPGYFEKVSGEALLGPDDALRRLRGTVEMASVLTQADSLTAKLKSEPGFFEVEKYPMAEFVSTEILPAPQGAVRDTHEIVGNLTLRGITRSIRFPARIEISPERFLLSAEFSVNRHDFGVSYEGGTAFPEIRDLVLINLDVDARRAPRSGAQDISDSASQEDATNPTP